jgi:membrane associated rhomboid family serine protease
MTYYRYRFSFGYGFTPAVKNLMIIMGAVFLLQMLIPGQYYYLLALNPYDVWNKYFLWQLFTYIFLH